MIQGVSDEIQFLAGNIEPFLDEFLSGSHIVSQDDKLRRSAVIRGAKAYEGIDAGMHNPEDIHEELKGAALG